MNNCQYCQEPFKSVIDEAGWDLEIEKDPDNYYWLVMSITNKGFASNAINYCPICGRKLGD